MGFLDPRTWCIFLVALFLAYGGGRLQQHHADAETYQAERTKEALIAFQARNKAVDEARTEEQRRTTEQARIANEATKQTRIANSDAASARDAAARLRKRVNELIAASRASSNSTSATSSTSQPSSDPIALLANMQQRLDDAAGQFGEYADNLKVAGLACEQNYDSLTKK